MISLGFRLHHNILSGGPGGNRTPVHDAFTTKELQQFFITVSIIYLLLSPVNYYLTCVAQSFRICALTGSGIGT